MRLFFSVLCVASLCGLTCGQGSGLNEEQRAFISQRETIVEELATFSQELHARRREFVEKCECSKHGCSNDFMESPCVYHFGTFQFCTTEGWRIDVHDTIFRTAPGANPNDLSPSLKENICVYKHMVDWAVRYNDSEHHWIYVATLDGHFRRWPASARRRGDPDGDRLLHNCSTFDPRLRPWFTAASTGPKDIVIIVDRSGSMNDLIGTGGKTKWDLTVDAVESMLDTFNFVDFVNVVTFSDEATALNENGLLRGEKENLQRLKMELSDAYPRGKTNFTAAFTTAFDQLSNYCKSEPATCSNCQKIILFLTDGRDTSAPGGQSVKPSTMSDIIKDLQQMLRTQTKKEATIFTYSMSEQADDAIPRQIACSNDGAWAFIGPNTDPLDALNSYYLYIASGRKNVKPVWVEPFEDASGLGQITTVAVPFFARATADGPNVFLGVVGHDVPLADLELAGATNEQVLNEIIDRSERCVLPETDPCELQAYRNSRDKRAICADPYPVKEVGDSGDVMCFNRRGKFYKRFLQEVSWDEAIKKCEIDEGQLISIKDKTELAFVANLASLDGSWIGARRDGAVYAWLNSSIAPIEEDSEIWGVQEPFYRTGTEDCVAIDTRGATSNLKARPCDDIRTYICKYDSEAYCKAGVTILPASGFQSVPPLENCIDVAEVLLNETKPITEAARLSSRDVMCPLGVPNRTSEEVICCGASAMVEEETGQTSALGDADVNEVDADAADGPCLSWRFLMFLSSVLLSAHVLFV